LYILLDYWPSLISAFKKTRVFDMYDAASIPRSIQAQFPGFVVFEKYVPGRIHGDHQNGQPVEHSQFPQIELGEFSQGMDE